MYITMLLISDIQLMQAFLLMTYFFSNGFDVDEVRYMAFNNTEIMLHFSAEVGRTRITL